MEPMSRTERTALCNTALEVGPAAPTLCGEWNVHDLVAHLLVRERDPLGAPGIAVPRLEGLTSRSMRRLKDHDFTLLVERVRNGPPVWSPFRLPPVDRAVNTLEYFVHHEDIRRAQPDWQPRELTERQQRALFRAISLGGKAAVRKAGVPVTLRTPEGQEAVLRKGDGVVLTGRPSELVLLLFGRDQVHDLDFDGPADQVTRLKEADLGL